MSTYNEPSICPICGDRTVIQIRAYGDYDGPDHGYVTDPDKCKKCAGIKMMSPELWQRMKTVWENAEKKLKEVQKQRNELFDQYITNWEVESHLHALGGHGRSTAIWKFFQRKLASHNAIAKTCEGKQYGENGDWALCESLKATMWEFWKKMESNKKRFRPLEEVLGVKKTQKKIVK